MITLTPAALQRITTIRQRAHIDPELYVRIRVVGGGCAGFTYDTYFDRAQADDEKVTQGSETILLDAMTVTYMSGTLVDVTASGFVFKNPQAQVHCNCGASFRTFRT